MLLLVVVAEKKWSSHSKQRMPMRADDEEPLGRTHKRKRIERIEERGYLSTKRCPYQLVRCVHQKWLAYCYCLQEAQDIVPIMSLMLTPSPRNGVSNVVSTPRTSPVIHVH